MNRLSLARRYGQVILPVLLACCLLLSACGDSTATPATSATTAATSTTTAAAISAAATPTTATTSAATTVASSTTTAAATGKTDVPVPSDKPVVITLSAPNQWNDSGTSFGPGWESAIDQFQKLNPGVTIKINVLPLNSFFQTLSTQLASGTAPDIVFNQATYRPEMVTRLDDYLNQPNPYAPETPKWIDVFNPNAFSFTNPQSVAADGHLYWVPLTLFGVGVFYNKDAFDKAGVKAPLKTWEDWRGAVKKLKAAGYTPLAMDNSVGGYHWSSSPTMNSLLSKYFDQWNLFDATGNPGKNSALTIKSQVRAIKEGKLNAALPEFVEFLKFEKELYAEAATPNWSGIKGLSGAGVGLPDFISGKAAMAIGAPSGASEVSKGGFTVGSMPMPTVTNASSSLSANVPAQFGVSAGGTSYMIPSTTKGDQLKYAVRFLQFMTAPKYSQPWITTTAGIPSLTSVQPIPSLQGFIEGDWGKTPIMNPSQLLQLTPQQSQDFQQILTGYFLGSSSLADVQSKLDAAWKTAANTVIKQNPDWSKEDWAK